MPIESDMPKEPTITLDSLRESALLLGATDAKVIPADAIPIEDEIIDLCVEPLCPGYDKSANCPPHIMKPAEARGLVSGYEWALLFKIDVPSEVLLSEDRFESFRRIYEIASQIEVLARNAGYSSARGFAAGSCKPVFCKKLECLVLAENADCRSPDLARPSMEAVGMNVFKLVEEVGWEIHRLTKASNPDSVPMGLLAGLVLLA
jgi:predicted metal-binding protein